MLQRLAYLAPVLGLYACVAAAALAADADAPPPPTGDDADLEQPAIPPNQEALLGEMLGKDTQLPAGCTLSSGDVEHTLVKATYACPSGDVVIQLAHPGLADHPLVSTDRFALTVLSGTPPPDLPNAIAGLIRAHEAAFVWKVPTAHHVAPNAVALWAVPLLLGLALLAWAWRRRRAQPDGRAAPEA